jgi:hypothetical protein
MGPRLEASAGNSQTGGLFFVVAIISYYCIERPFLRWRVDSRERRIRAGNRAQVEQTPERLPPDSEVCPAIATFERRLIEGGCQPSPLSSIRLSSRTLVGDRLPRILPHKRDRKS